MSVTVFQKVVWFFTTFFKKPLLSAFMLGMTSGFPLTIILGIMTVWLRQYDISKTAIGLFALATLPYSLKILWSPLLDRGYLGGWAKLIGRRRSWIVIVCALMAAAIWRLSVLTPDQDLWHMAATCVAIGFLSASLDILIDAYRIEVTEERDLAHSAGMYQWGYRLANLIAGVSVFTVAESMGWGFAISLLPLLILPGVFAIFWMGEPKVDEDEFLIKEREKAAKLNKYAAWFREAVILPFKEFALRPNWYWILLFIVVVKFGDVAASIMTGPLLVDLGYTLTEMAYANKAVGAVAAGIGGGLGIAIWWSLGVYRSLLVTIIFMMVTNLGFVWLSVVGHDNTTLAIVVALENLATGAGSTVMIAYFSSLCNLSFTATQYALLSMLSGLARGFFGGTTGVVADMMSWPMFFLFSTVLAIPGLIFLLILWKKNIGVEEKAALGTG